jgi:hypothetical protein
VHNLLVKEYMLEEDFHENIIGLELSVEAMKGDIRESKENLFHHMMGVHQRMDQMMELMLEMRQGPPTAAWLAARHATPVQGTAAQHCSNSAAPGTDHRKSSAAGVVGDVAGAVSGAAVGSYNALTGTMAGSMGAAEQALGGARHAVSTAGPAVFRGAAPASLMMSAGAPMDRR